MKSRDIVDSVLFSLSYYAAWFATLLLASRHQAVLAFSVIVGVTLLQMSYFYYRKAYSYSVMVLQGVTLLGFAIDSSLTALGYFKFVNNAWSPLAPVWLLGLWFNFSAAIAIYHPWAYRYKTIIRWLALAAFPFAYLCGQALGAVTFHYGSLSSILLGLIWWLLLPAVITIIHQRK